MKHLKKLKLNEEYTTQPFPHLSDVDYDREGGDHTLKPVQNPNFEISIERKNKEDYFIQKSNGEVIYEGNFDECRGFMRGFYYNKK